MFVDLIPWPTANLGVMSLLIITALWFGYTTIRGTWATHSKSDGTKGVPSTFPCVFPLLGSLPIIYLWKPRDFVLDPK